MKENTLKKYVIGIILLLIVSSLFPGINGDPA